MSSFFLSLSLSFDFSDLQSPHSLAYSLSPEALDNVTKQLLGTAADGTGSKGLSFNTAQDFWTSTFISGPDFP